MAVFAGWRYRLRTVLRPRKARAELEEAIRLDLELEAMHRTMPHATHHAMHPAMLHADERPATDEASRLAGMVEETWGLPGVRDVMLDVPHVLRLVRATPASTLWILAVASLGVGAIQAVLSVGAVLRTITPAEPQFLQVLHLLIGAAVLLWGMATLVTTRSLVARTAGRREMMVARVSAGAAVPDVLRHLRFEALMLAGGRWFWPYSSHGWRLRCSGRLFPICRCSSGRPSVFAGVPGTSLSPRRRLSSPDSRSSCSPHAGGSE